VYMTATPEGTPYFAPQKVGLPGAPNLHKVHSKIAKKVDANLLMPTYRFNAPVAYGDTGRGYKKSVAQANVAPALDLVQADSGFYSVKGAWGGLTLEEPVRLAESVGSITQIDSSTSQDVALFTFDTFRSIAKGEYAFTLDLDAYKAAVLKAATDFNSVLVEELKVAAPK